MPLKAKPSGELVPVFDVTSAAMFGTVEHLLGPRAAPWNPDPIVEELDEKLHDFNDNDWLLCIGNPILIGIATAIASAFNHGRVNMLQWNGKEQRYIPVKVDLS